MNNPQAFPSSESWNDENPQVILTKESGMTLRDYFAAKAMQGWLAGAANLPALPPASNIADFAYDMADAMLAQREKQ